ncbi:hypothetical protein TvY486_0005200 [Trypanosoma vivax Y486]|uniref:Uncharacterized protein n=1 Tax=Trypanosoma vivax (strain Y486) TaxID=1055687 RepID=F9WW16_TRYVY|nr:hypothetical protein TvY486_0005200 [Trypanosoma vivax Y486]|eukprot:CCD21783.1 hypothetical protein TvY486_0005200 [Trypanosoma vivax Y486]
MAMCYSLPIARLQSASPSADILAVSVLISSPDSTVSRSTFVPPCVSGLRRPWASLLNRKAEAASIPANGNAVLQDAPSNFSQVPHKFRPKTNAVAQGVRQTKTRWPPIEHPSCVTLRKVRNGRNGPQRPKVRGQSRAAMCVVRRGVAQHLRISPGREAMAECAGRAFTPSGVRIGCFLRAREALHTNRAAANDATFVPSLEKKDQMPITQHCHEPEACVTKPR